MVYNTETDILHGDPLGRLKSSMEEKRKLQISCLELRLPIFFSHKVI
ncbi:hypothetical protein RchiOBHm_Chr2g0140831 [Rosa chinensis]|uniref:Uncharacterized protein n=1 Tax=Rosa chinensis TaxID=74649 RepID=A0A2P6RXH2_ROSCH|nr:hypothetical protein RchiOBHm_Chr2g0140831 [Rosa chinensis]